MCAHVGSCFPQHHPTSPGPYFRSPAEPLLLWVFYPQRPCSRQSFPPVIPPPSISPGLDRTNQPLLPRKPSDPYAPHPRQGMRAEAVYHSLPHCGCCGGRSATKYQTQRSPLPQFHPFFFFPSNTSPLPRFPYARVFCILDKLSYIPI